MDSNSVIVIKEAIDMTPELWANFLLFIVTTVYVILTYHILKVMKKQHEASLRPYVVPATFVVPGNGMLCLRIANNGKMAAENVRLDIDRDFYKYGSTKDEHNLKDAYIFNNPIGTLVPGTELLFYLGMGFHIFGENTDPLKTPSKFIITAKYQYLEKTVEEKTVIDLEAYRMSSLPPQESIVTQLKEIVKAIKDKKTKDKQKQ